RVICGGKFVTCRCGPASYKLAATTVRARTRSPMQPCHSCDPPGHGGLHRPAFLADLGVGFTRLALAAMLPRDGFASPATNWVPPDGRPHFPPRAKSVIWLFLNGGVSHLESFDPKPELNKYSGKTIAETPYKDVQNPEKLKLARVVVIND